MKNAYREAKNLVALSRTLEYLRRKGKVVVADKVTFDGKGRFETALTTFGEVKDLGGGAYRFSSFDGKATATCKVSVKGSGWHLEKEQLPEEAGSQFEGRAKAKPFRIAIVLDEPVHEAEVSVEWNVR